MHGADTSRSHLKVILAGLDGVQQPAQVEAHLESAPDDLTARLRLLGHYWRARDEDPAARPEYLRHVLWLIRHRPHLEVSASPYAQPHPITDGNEAWAAAAAAWEDALAQAPDEAEVLLGAARFYTVHDLARAEAILRRGAELRGAATRRAATATVSALTSRHLRWTQRLRLGQTLMPMAAPR